MENEYKEVNVGKFLEEGLESLSSLWERMHKHEVTNESLVEAIDKLLKKALPKDYRDITTKWEDPNKIIITFNRVRARKKTVDVLEVV